MAVKKAEAAEAPEEKVPERIVIEWVGAKYTLEYDRESALQAEKMFDISLQDITRLHMSAFQGLFYGAFIKHHPRIKAAALESILEAVPDKIGLFRLLAQMYAESVNTLLEEPEEGKAATWTAL